MSDQSLQPILALLAYPVAGNPTQYMFEKAFAHHEMDWRYLTLEVGPEDLADAVRGIRAMGFAGGNCAEPHKKVVAPYLDRVTPMAEQTGVVNLIYWEDEELVGDNTEGMAVLESLCNRVDLSEKRIVLLGAGHLARAIGLVLSQKEPAQLTVLNRTKEHADDLIAILPEEFKSSALSVTWEDDYTLPEETDILINATSISFRDTEACLPLAMESLNSQMLVVDCVNDPPNTRLLDEAASRGCAIINGLEIGLHKTAINFYRWTGVQPDLTIMREAVEEFLEL